MKTVLITGASSGIGQAAALHLAQKGFRVLAGVRKEKDAAPWNDVPNTKAVHLDVTQEESVRACAESLQKELARAEEVHLVNNAGIAVAGPVEGVPIARWQQQFDVNVFGLLRVTQAFLPFVRATRGRIVNISSVSGIATSPYLGPYSASKFAVEAISDALRRELRIFGCRVVVLEPGPIATPIWEKGLAEEEQLLGDLSPAMRKVYAKGIEQFRKGAEVSAKGAASVEKVSRAIERALTAARPQPRVVVGARFLPTAMKVAGMLPDSWVDALVAREFS